MNRNTNPGVRSPRMLGGAPPGSDLTTEQAAALASAIARLQELLGLQAEAPAGAALVIRTEADSWPRELLAQDVQQLLTSPELVGYLPADVPWQDAAKVVFSRGRADLSAFEAKRRLEALRPRTWNETVRSVTEAAGRALLIPIVLGVTVPAITGLFSVYYQVASHKQQQSFDLQKEQLVRLSEGLGELEIEAQELEWSVVEAEKQPLTEIRKARFHSSSRRLSRKFRQVTQIVEFPPNSEAFEAELRAFYELEALSMCLDTAGAGDAAVAGAQARLGEHINGQVAAGQVPAALADELKSESTVSPPCGANFDSSSFGNLSIASARLMWGVLGGSTFKGLSD